MVDDRKIVNVNEDKLELNLHFCDFVRRKMKGKNGADVEEAG